jgi:Zn-dependent protease with chaperone function
MGSITRRRQLVERAEREARESPQAYKTRLLLLAALGYGVVLVAVTIGLSLSVGLVVALWLYKKSLVFTLAKVLWIPIALSWVMLRSLWVTFDVPPGHLLAPGEAPALRSEIERLRIAAGAPALDGIVIDQDLNAAAASQPRVLGLFGHRYYLILGLPLMQRLDPEAFAAVIAHEFGHFGGKHGHFTGWIYRVRMTWYVLLASLEAQRSFVTGWFVRFFEVYAPYFNAYSYVLARNQEHEADATAARIVGPAALGRALVRLDTGADLLEQRFWPEIERARSSSPQPPSTLLADVARTLRARHDDDDARLARVLARQSDDEDTHPSLKDRLAALGVQAEPLEACTHSAADAWLGDLAPQLEARFSREWQESVAEHWVPTEAGKLHGEDAAALRDTIAAAPDDVSANARLGELLLSRDDADGVAPLRRAIERDPDRRYEWLTLLDAYYARTGGDLALRDGIAEELRACARAYSEVEKARTTLSKRDQFVPHGLDAATVQRVCDVLKLHPVKRVWVVRKDLGEATRMPHHVIIVRFRFWMLASRQGAVERIAQGLEFLPGTFWLTEESVDRGAVRKIRRTAGVPTYHRR